MKNKKKGSIFGYIIFMIILICLVALNDMLCNPGVSIDNRSRNEIIYEEEMKDDYWNHMP